MKIMKLMSSNTINKSVYTNNNDSMQTNPSFTSFKFFKFSPKHVNLDANLAIFSPKELKKLRKNVAFEINEIINMPATPGLIKRLDDLLNSPFVDYKTEYFDNLGSLADKIVHNHSKEKGTEMYRHFVLTSLSKTMPMELVDKRMKPTLANGNGAIIELLNSYSKMDESTPQAEAIRKMLQRFKDAQIPVDNKNFYLTQSIINNQPIMTKNYLDLFQISPFEKIEIIKEPYMYELRDAFGNPNAIYDSTIKKKFIVVNPQMVKNLADDYFKYMHSVSNISLYNLAGLMHNKEINEAFDIVNFLKSVIGKYELISLKRGSKRTHEFENFLVDSAKYHPEHDSLEFFEKYIKSFDFWSELDSFKGLLNEYPFTRLDNKNALNEINQRFLELKQKPNVENEKEIHFLSTLYNDLSR